MSKLIIIAAPSGAGKTTIVRHLIQKFDGQLVFSISATSRQPRVNELNGRDYFFISKANFEQKIAENDFVEWEEVYAGLFYGTLKSEIDRNFDNGNSVIFDVDVKGGLNLKNQYGPLALAIFIKPPSLQALELRLRNRKTETEEKIKMRLERARFEMSFEDKYDHVVVNDDLESAKQEAFELVETFLNQNKIF
jgi:guanylate kinase